MVLRELEEHGVEVYPGSVRYLRAVKDAGPATAVVTASANGEKVIAAGGFADLIDVRVDGLVAARDALRGKPEPDTFLAAARLLGVEPSEAVVYEDAISGVEAGRAGGRVPPALELARGGQSGEPGADDRDVGATSALVARLRAAGERLGGGAEHRAGRGGGPCAEQAPARDCVVPWLIGHCVILSAAARTGSHVLTNLTRRAFQIVMDLKLRPRPPFDPSSLLGFFARRAVAGVEAVTDGAYRRSLRLVGGVAVVELRPRHDAIRVRATVADPADRDVVEAACRTLFDLDAEPSRVLEVLGSDPVIGDAVRAAPGRRVPGHPDPAELAIRAVIGQQVSVAGAVTIAGRLVAEFGPPLAEPVDGVTHLFPAPAALAALDPESLPMPRRADEH